MNPFSFHNPESMPRHFLKGLTVSSVCELPIRFYRTSLPVGGQTLSLQQRVTPEIKTIAELVPESAGSKQMWFLISNTVELENTG